MCSVYLLRHSVGTVDRFIVYLCIIRNTWVLHCTFLKVTPQTWYGNLGSTPGQGVAEKFNVGPQCLRPVTVSRFGQKRKWMWDVMFPLQVQLLYELLLSWSSTWARLQRHGILRQTSTAPEPPAGAAPSSPVRSSAGTALPDTSTCSPSADFGSPTEVRRFFFLSRTHTHIYGTSFLLSVQWFLWVMKTICTSKVQPLLTKKLSYTTCTMEWDRIYAYSKMLKKWFIFQWTVFCMRNFCLIVKSVWFSDITPFMSCHSINKRPNDATLPTPIHLWVMQWHALFKPLVVYIVLLLIYEFRLQFLLLWACWVSANTCICFFGGFFVWEGLSRLEKSHQRLCFF